MRGPASATLPNRSSAHIGVHSPDKPRTLARYCAVLDHFQRLLGKRLFVEAISRGDIDEYKAARSLEMQGCHREDHAVHGEFRGKRPEDVLQLHDPRTASQDGEPLRAFQTATGRGRQGARANADVLAA